MPTCYLTKKACILTDSKTRIKAYNYVRGGIKKVTTEVMLAFL